MLKDKYDAVVVGSGPNGLAAAIVLQQKGLEVLLIEGKETIGGGLRSSEQLLPGYVLDVCSAIHPMAVQSPFFKSLALEDYGLKFIHPAVLAAHPMDGGDSVGLFPSLVDTAAQLGLDEDRYMQFFGRLSRSWPALIEDVLAPLHIPKRPLDMIRFGYKALPSAKYTARSFKTEKLKALWAGMAGHAMLPLNYATTSAVALVLLLAGHTAGWPVPEGGSQSIANALASYFKSLGGEIKTDYYVDSLQKLPAAKALLFDVGPKQLLEIAGHKFSDWYRKQLQRYRYGMGVFKMDWLLEGAIPFRSATCLKAGTVHIGNTFSEIAEAEHQTWHGHHPEKPFVLLAQQSLFDTTRTPGGSKQVVWAYCHVPHGSTKDMSRQIERQIERFAPGFMDCVVAKQSMDAQQFAAYNPNYVGGDINGGAMDITQLFTRPALLGSPYRTSVKGIYICSSSTPPGGGVHGMCGYHAAHRAWNDLFSDR